MKQSRHIEVIRPTLRGASRGKGLPMANVLTAGAALLAIVLSVSLSSAANTSTCARPIEEAVSAPCHFR